MPERFRGELFIKWRYTNPASFLPVIIYVYLYTSLASYTVEIINDQRASVEMILILRPIKRLCKTVYDCIIQTAYTLSRCLFSLLLLVCSLAENNSCLFTCLLVYQMTRFSRLPLFSADLEHRW